MKKDEQMQEFYTNYCVETILLISYCSFRAPEPIPE